MCLPWSSLTFVKIPKSPSRKGALSSSQRHRLTVSPSGVPRGCGRNLPREPPPSLKIPTLGSLVPIGWRSTPTSPHSRSKVLWGLHPFSDPTPTRPSHTVRGRREDPGRAHLVRVTTPSVHVCDPCLPDSVLGSSSVYGASEARTRSEGVFPVFP